VKVPTYSKYGLKKIEIERSDERDRKVTKLLTHTLPLAAGGALGIVVFFIYFFKSGQTTVFSVFYQIFLFGTIGIVCVGIPMVFFVIAERLYFHYQRSSNKKYRSVMQYKSDRADFDFWKLRSDEKFWNSIDGLSLEKEVVNIFMHNGYDFKGEYRKSDNEFDHLLSKDGKLIYLDCKTGPRLEDLDYVKNLLENMNNARASELILVSRKGFGNSIMEFVKDKAVRLYTIGDIINLIREIGKD